MNSKISCLALMPFDEQFTFVYIYGIVAATNSLGDVNIETTRVDNTSATKNKIEEIKRYIENADIIISDITHYRPSVLWEIGYASALNKDIIYIQQEGLNNKQNKRNKAPFNLQGVDIIKYRFSVKGLEDFVRTFKDKAANIIHNQSKILRYDSEIKKKLITIEECLKEIHINSLLKNLATNEIVRLSTRIEKLRAGQFDLRNEKPNEEIIKNYCDYMSQITGEEGEFITATCYEFWKEITNDGENMQYLDSNTNAAESGATIKRIFIINPNPTQEQKILLKKILDKFFEDNQTITNKIDLRIIFNTQKTNYDNFGLMKKGDEKLLFLPEYVGSRRDKMKETVFHYSSNTPKKIIDTYELKFTRYYKQSEPLSKEHIDNL